MRLTADERFETGERRYVLILERGDLERFIPEPFDLALIRECDQSASIADKLLALECIARRIENGSHHR